MEEGRDDEGMDVDTPPLSAVSRPEQATIVWHDGLEQGHAGNLSNEAELLTGAEVGSGRTANDVRRVRGFGGQRHMVVLPAYAEVVAEGLSGHGTFARREGEQWEPDLGHNLRGEAGLSPALSLGRRDSGERITLRCSSFHLPPPRPSSLHHSLPIAASTWQLIDQITAFSTPTNRNAAEKTRSTPAPTSKHCASDKARSHAPSQLILHRSRLRSVSHQVNHSSPLAYLLKTQKRAQQTLEYNQIPLSLRTLTTQTCRDSLCPPAKRTSSTATPISHAPRRSPHRCLSRSRHQCRRPRQTRVSNAVSLLYTPVIHQPS